VVIFFFQAEDGIRGLTVTGVQTCALPIFDAAPAARDPAATRRARALRPPAVSRPATPPAPDRGSPGPSRAPAWGRTSRADGAGKIGRASCRERGWGGGGGAS